MPLKDMYQAGKCNNQVTFYCLFYFSHSYYGKHTVQQTVMSAIINIQIQTS